MFRSLVWYVCRIPTTNGIFRISMPVRLSSTTSFTFEKLLPRERILFLCYIYQRIYLHRRSRNLHRTWTEYCLNHSWLAARSEPEKGEKQNGIMVRRLKGETKDEEGESERAIGNLCAPGNRVSLKRNVDSFVDCVINSATMSRQITRRGCVTI